jgi:hypothetical protein
MILPLFMDAGGFTIRVNPNPSPTGYLGLQIMEPPEYDPEKSITLRDGKFTQIFLTKDQAKNLADILYAQLTVGLTGT